METRPMDKAIKHKIIDLDNKSKENIELPSFIFLLSAKSRSPLKFTSPLKSLPTVTA